MHWPRPAVGTNCICQLPKSNKDSPLLAMLQLLLPLLPLLLVRLNV